MSVRVMGRVWDLEEFPTDPKPERGPVSGAALKLVLLAIADHADHNGANAWPSIDRLARMTGLTRRSVQRATASLQRRGLLQVRDQAGGDSDTPPDRRPNRYKLTLGTGRQDDTPRDDTVAPRGAPTTTRRGDNDDATGRHHDTRTVHEPSRTVPLAAADAAAGESTPSAATFADRFEALVAACYPPGAQLTDIETGRTRRAARSLERVDATSGHIASAARRFRDLWPNAPLTPQAIVGNWNLLALATDAEIAAAEVPEPAQRFDPDCDCHGGWIFNTFGAVEPCQCTAPKEA